MEKLLHTIRSLDPRDGGVVGMTRDLVRAAARCGDVSEVCTLDAPDTPWLKSWPGRVHALGPARRTYGYTSRLTPWIRAHAGDYNAVVIHGLWQYNSLGAWRGLNGRAPHMVFPHGMLDGWFREHQPLKHLKKALYWPLEHAVLRSAAAVCFTAEEELRNGIGTFSPYACRNVVVGAGIEPPPNTIGSQAKAFQDHFPTLAARRFVLFLGRLHPKKGCDLFVKAFAQLAMQWPGIDAVLAGPDPGGMEPALRAMLPGSLQSRLHFTGMLDGEMKWAALRAADVFIIPSHQENFCLAAAESLACGTPVLTSDKVNIWHEITSHGAGFVQPDTLEGTVALLRKWEETPSQERHLMREKARDCHAKHFSIDRVYEKLLATLV